MRGSKGGGVSGRGGALEEFNFLKINMVKLPRIYWVDLYMYMYFNI